MTPLKLCYFLLIKLLYSADDGDYDDDNDCDNYDDDQ